MAPSSSKHARRKHKKASQTSRKLKVKKASQANSANPEDLARSARDLAESGNLPEAISKLEKAIERRPTDVSLLEELASFYMQASLPDNAETILRRTIELCPSSGFEKFAYLAQLLGYTEEALEMARQGIKLMREEMRLLRPENKERMRELRQYLTSALCAVAEICLGIIEDSNDPAVAEAMDEQVEKAIMEALGICEQGTASEIEAMLALANLRLSQARKDEARISMNRVMESMSRGIEMLENGDGSDTTTLAALEILPAMEIRIAVGKQLIEVEMWHEAVSVLASVMWECDFNVEVWYLLAVAYWKQAEVAEARSALENTRAVLHNPDGCDGELEEEMIDKLYEELRKVHSEAGAPQQMEE